MFEYGSNKHPQTMAFENGKNIQDLGVHPESNNRTLWSCILIANAITNTFPQMNLNSTKNDSALRALSSSLMNNTNQTPQHQPTLG